MCIQTGSGLQENGLLPSLLFLYGILSCASLLLLPIRNMGWQFVLWDWSIFWNAVSFATPELPLYSMAALKRLILYILFAMLLSRHREAKRPVSSSFCRVALVALFGLLL